MFGHGNLDDKTRTMVALTKIFVNHKNRPLDSKELFRELYDKYNIDCWHATSLTRLISGSGLFIRTNIKSNEDIPKKAHSATYEFSIKPDLYDVIINELGHRIHELPVAYVAGKLEHIVKQYAGKIA